VQHLARTGGARARHDGISEVAFLEELHVERSEAPRRNGGFGHGFQCPADVARGRDMLIEVDVGAPNLEDLLHARRAIELRDGFGE